LGVAVARLGPALTAGRLLGLGLGLLIGLTLLYALLLALTGLVFWSAGFLFTWVLDGLLQMARYPVGLYPGWLRLFLTWIVPVGLITTVPAQALTGTLPPGLLAVAAAFSLALLLGASALFRAGVRRYASASS
jgi:ABC-2 type transport system permease protein